VLADAEILPEHLSAEVRAIGDREFSTPNGMNLRDRTAALELDLVRLALERTEGNLTRAAELLGLSRFGLQKMLKRLAGRLAEATGPKPSIELSGLR
jgi:DNA-binding protein Fis